MASLTWNSVLPNFSGSSQAMANAQRGIGQAGQIADSVLDNYRKDETLKLQEQQLGMQKAEHQMKLDARDELLKEKTAANNYASGLSSVLSGGVVGVEDQKNLGDLMNSEAARIRATSPQATDAEVAAKMNDYQKSVLPTMVSKFDKSPEEQLKALRGTNPLGGLSAIAPQTRIALLKEAEAPIEKQQAAAAAYANKLEEQKIRAQEALMNRQLSTATQLAIANQGRQTQIDIAKANRENQVAMKELELKSKDHKTIDVLDDQGRPLLLTAAELKQAAAEGKSFTLPAPGNGSGGGSSNAKGKLNANKEYTTMSGVTIPDFAVFGHGDTAKAGKYIDKVAGSGWTTKELQTGVDSFNVSTPFWRDRYIDEDNIDTILLPKELKDGSIIPASTAVAISEIRGLSLASDKNGKVKWGGTGKEVTGQELLELGFRKVNGVIVKNDASANTVISNLNKTGALLPSSTKADALYGGPIDPMETDFARRLRVTKAAEAAKAAGGNSSSLLPIDPYSTIDDNELDNINAILSHRNANNTDLSGNNITRLLSNKPLK